MTINRRGRFRISDLRGEPPSVPPLVGNLDPPIGKTLRNLFALLTVMMLKRVSENIFFQSNKVKACKVNDGRVTDKIFVGVQATEDYPSISR